MRYKTFLLAALVSLALLGAVYEGVAYWRDLAPGDGLLSLWELFFLVLLVLWVDADSMDQPKIYRPYDYGYLVFLFWLPYLPYYLWRTRGPVGMLMLGGFVSLLLLGHLVQWALFVFTT